MKKNNLASGCWNEAVYITRYTGSGAVNTTIGFIVVLTAMAIGFSPVVSNMAGYAVGFTLGFLLSKKFVFRSDGHFVTESVRYLVAFIISFLFNLLVLHIAISNFDINAVISQVMAVASYTVLMYILTRLYVFRALKHQGG